MLSASAKRAQQELKQYAGAARRIREMEARRLAAEEHADVAAQLADEIMAIKARRIRIQDAINRIEKVDEQRVLELRYIDGLSWSAVERRMYISKSESFRLHGSALESYMRAKHRRKTDTRGGGTGSDY